MEMILTCLLCILFTCIWVTALQYLRKADSKKLPPGPTPFPIIGNLLEVGANPHRSLANLAKKHGPIMTLQLGQVTTIVISSSTVAKEILKNHDLSFCNRTVPDAILAEQHGEIGMPWLPVTTAWRSLRKISNSHIFTTQKLDANQYLRREKIQQLLAHVQESCDAGRAIEVGQAAFNTTLNLLSNTVFSIDLADPSSEFAREFKKLVWGIMEEAGKPNLNDYFPILRKIDPQGIRRRMGVHFREMLKMFDRLIVERLKQRQLHGSEPKDMLDTLLNITEDKSEEIDRDQIKHLLLDLFAAGTDTTSSTLEWAMTELIRNPETLSKARLELEQIIGKGNQIEESDVSRLPYLQAIVKETFRLHPPVPLLLPRKASSDVEICSYKVPEGAQVLVNVWAIGRDGSTCTWDDPNSFVPERFLGSDVDVRGRNFELIPFGAGRRICPGLPLAMRMLYLMLGTLIHSFGWKLEGGLKPEMMDMDDKFGITLQRAQPLRAVPVAL
ncbi:hypothetical protein LWI29_025999 [Acer saccharum]|uniref:Geraniol 8-hydroxylase-like n=1 Tax=Acer saccharum TaxID=4024 RepID=A0AA39VRD2_ACESA|nr:hypothetical protein LWI29_025999 [Acer saccharum]